VSDTSHTLTRVGEGRYLIVTADGQQRIAYAAASPNGTWVFLDGRTFLVEPASSSTGRAASRHDDATALSSPMPATVVRVQVEIGQQVHDGDVLVVLEAMKMELSIKAPRDGRVTAIACREGELVQPGMPLLEIE